MITAFVHHPSALAVEFCYSETRACSWNSASMCVLYSVSNCVIVGRTIRIFTLEIEPWGPLRPYRLSDRFQLSPINQTVMSKTINRSHAHRTHRVMSDRSLREFVVAATSAPRCPEIHLNRGIESLPCSNAWQSVRPNLVPCFNLVPCSLELPAPAF